MGIDRIQNSKQKRSIYINNNNTCSELGCDKPSKHIGYCKTHYYAHWANNIKKLTCTIELCNKSQRKRGLCRIHYELQLENRCEYLDFATSKMCNKASFKEKKCKKHFYIGIKCCVKDCNNAIKVKSRELCAKHYKLQYRIDPEEKGPLKGVT